MTKGPKIFGIGLSKTGTTSLFLALDLLGYRSATYRHTSKIGLKDWWAGEFDTDYLQDFDAVTDLPIGTYFRELDRAYPGSKFILTERPVDSWLTSIEKQFRNNPNPDGGFARDSRMSCYGVSTFEKDRFSRIFAEHSQSVRQYFSRRPNDLLVQNYWEDNTWNDLCHFLQKPIPATPFPNVKPGAKKNPNKPPAPKETPSQIVAIKSAKLTFVIPIVHPDGKKLAIMRS